MNKFKVTKINLIKFQKNYWFLMQMIQDLGFDNPTSNKRSQAKQRN